MDEIRPLPIPRGLLDLDDLIALQQRKLSEAFSLPPEMLRPPGPAASLGLRLELARQQERVLRQVGIRLGWLLPETAPPAIAGELQDETP